MIKAILWDVDGVLLDFLAAEKAAIRTCFDVLGLGVCSDEMLASYSKINVKYWEALERGEMTKPQILVGRFREFFDKYGLDVEKAEAFNSEYQIRLGDTIVFNDGALEIVKTLHERNVIQCIVTNGTKIAQTKKLKNSRIEEYVDHIYISEEIGVEKPGKGFFDAVFADLPGVKPEEMIIVGDSLTSDMKGGENCGIQTCWYNPNGKINSTGVRVDCQITNLKQILDMDIDWKRN